MTEHFDAYKFMEDHLDSSISLLVEIDGNAKTLGGKLHTLFDEMPGGAIILQLALNNDGSKLDKYQAQEVYSSYQRRTK